jgi:hypothetical protein
MVHKTECAEGSRKYQQRARKRSIYEVQLAQRGFDIENTALVTEDLGYAIMTPHAPQRASN